MKSLKNKASRFFKDGPNQDERIANTEPDDGEGFNAGIQDHDGKKKPTRFFKRKNDAAERLPSGPPSNASSSTLVGNRERNTARNDSPSSTTSIQTTKPGPGFAAPQFPSSQASSTTSPKVKPRPSFATLRSKSSRLFGSNNLGSASPPPPPVPQIPVDYEVPNPRREYEVPNPKRRGSSSSSTTASVRGKSISRPVLMKHSNLPIPENPPTVPFTKRPGPPPVRPPRPKSLDKETLAFMDQATARMGFMHSNRASSSTASSSIRRSHGSSLEARLGLPSGRSTPRTNSLDSPLAAQLPLDPSKPLPVRSSTGKVTPSRFSQYVRNEVGGYAGDGVDAEDRDLGPIECYDKSKDGEWTLVKTVSKGPNGNPGMLFRDKAGAFHFVADI